MSATISKGGETKEEKKIRSGRASSEPLNSLGEKLTGSVSGTWDSKVASRGNTNVFNYKHEIPGELWDMIKSIELVKTIMEKKMNMAVSLWCILANLNLNCIMVGIIGK